MKKIFIALILSGFVTSAFALTPEKAIYSLLDSTGNLGQAKVVTALTQKFKSDNLKSALISYVNSHDESPGSLLAAELLSRSAYSESGAAGLFKLVMSPVEYLSRNATDKLVDVLNSGDVNDVRLVRAFSLSQKTDLVERILQWTPKVKQGEYLAAVLKMGSTDEVSSIVKSNLQITNLSGLENLEKIRVRTQKLPFLARCRILLGQKF